MTTETTKKTLRFDDWWKGKAAHLMGLVYVLILWFHIPFSSFVPLSICSVTTIIGFASFGYLLNDYFDQAQDRAAGKSNIFQNKSLLEAAFLFGFSLSVMLAPWLYLPKDKISFSLIALQIILFLLYSLPVARLKERGLAGITVDALYAHVVPSVLAAYTFMLASESQIDFLPVLLLIIWQFLIGLRNILLHQFDDISADKKAGSRNFAATISVSSFHNTIHILSISELILAVLFFVVISQQQWLFWGAVFLLAVLLFLYVMKATVRLNRLFPHLDLKHFPNFVYESWLPVMLLCMLCSRDIAYAGILIIHCVLFEQALLSTIFRHTFSFGKQLLKHIFFCIRRIVSYIVNHAIFYLLLIFGINLKKEQMSAWKYFKKRLQKQESV